MSSNLNVNQFHEELIRQQGHQINDVAVGSTSQPAPLAPILATPFLGDGKVSRVSGMNDKLTDKLQKRMEARTDPSKHRSIGKKFAEFLFKKAGPYQEALTDPKMIPAFVAVAGTGGIVSERAVRDEARNIPISHGAFRSTLTGLGMGIGAGLLHKSLGHPKPLAHTAIYMGTLGTFAPLGYIASRKTHHKLNSIIDRYAQSQLTGTTLPSQTFSTHTSLTKEV